MFETHEALGFMGCKNFRDHSTQSERVNLELCLTASASQILYRNFMGALLLQPRNEICFNNDEGKDARAESEITTKDQLFSC